MAVADKPIDVDKLAEDYEAEKPGRRLGPIHDMIVQVACAGLSLYAIYWVLNPVPAQRYRTSFLAVALALTFLVYRGWGKRKEDADGTERPGVTDWLLAIGSIVALGYTLVTFDEFVRRAAQPNDLDIAFGVVTILLVLEATRRTVGWILPAVVIGFLLYAYFGGELPATWQISHAGYGVPRIVGQSYMGLSGIFGVPLDVAATYIILFTLYGAVLEYSGAGKFFLDISLAATGRSRTGPGRTTALAGFLLGTVSGSGVATTVTLGSVTWPILRRAGYPKEEGGGVLAASGIGAILSPPTLGAAAFIIAEFLKVSYLTVLLYARSRRSSTTSGSCWRSRPTRAASTPTRSSSSHRRSSGCCCATATTSRRCSRSCCCWRSASRPSAPCSTRPCSRSCSRSSTPPTGWGRSGSSRRSPRARGRCCRWPRPAPRRGSSSRS